MVASSLPQRISVGNLCGRGTVLSAQLAPAQVPRLASVLAHERWELAVDLRGAVDEGGHDVVTGDVSGVVPLQCVRCLQDFDLPLALQFEVVVVGSALAMQRLERDHDVWQADGDALALRDCVEDEIMLGLPTLPHCGRTDCDGRALEF